MEIVARPCDCPHLVVQCRGCGEKFVSVLAGKDLVPVDFFERCPHCLKVVHYTSRGSKSATKRARDAAHGTP